MSLFQRRFTPLKQWALTNLHIENEIITHSIAEFLGSLILSVICVGASAQYVLLGDSFIMPVLAGVFGLMISVAVVGGLSGAFINPAITLTFATTGEISWYKVPFYWASQMFGYFVGAGIGYALYKVRLERHFKTDDLTSIPSVSGIFSQFPADAGGTPIATGLADQIVGTSFYLMSIYSVIDPRNNPRLPPYILGAFLALVVAAVCFAFGINAGGVLNPARDLGPRLMAVAIGWSADDVFFYTDESGITHHYWLIPLFGPIIGAQLGAWTYILCIGAHIKRPAPEPELSDTKPEENNMGKTVSSESKSNCVLKSSLNSTSTLAVSVSTFNVDSFNHNSFLCKDEDGDGEKGNAIDVTAIPQLV